MQIAWLSKRGSQQLLETVLVGSHSYIKGQGVSKERLQLPSLPFFFFLFALAGPFSITPFGKGRLGIPDNPISKRQARCECERTGAEEWLPKRKRLAFDCAE